MNLILIFVSSLVAIGSSASDVKVIETKESSLTDGSVNERTVDLDLCAQKCSKEIESLKKNITELYAAFMTLQSQLEHLNRHMSFHEKALKHIAVWGHPHHRHHHHDDSSVREDSHNVTANNESISLSPEERSGSFNLRGQSDHRNGYHQHHGHHHNHQHHSHRPHNHNHHQSPPCGQCGGPHLVESVESVSENPNTKNKNKDKDKDDSEESPQESKPNFVTVLPNSELKDNESIAFNDSQTTKPSKNNFSKTLVEEQLYFQSMQTEFKEWFVNMLNDIHHNHGRVDRSDNGIKAYRRLDQSAIDDMENALNSEDLVFAICNVKPNRHIALLNQQDVEGTINMWQLKHSRGPLHMHIKLKGFKLSNHEDSHKHNGNHGHSNVRRVRESILMPVEVEPDESTLPMGASHSHGFHVHEFGNLSRDCQSVGNHYNPLNLSHGGPFDVIRHVGDLGNIRCNRNGEIDSELSYSHISLSGIHSIINRSLVIHSNIDDYGRNPNNPSSVQTGSSGVRIACCVIEEVKQLPKEVDSQSKIGSVASPVLTSKRRRDTSQQIFVNRNRYEDSNLSEILKRVAKYESDRKLDYN